LFAAGCLVVGLLIGLTLGHPARAVAQDIPQPYGGLPGYGPSLAASQPQPQAMLPAAPALAPAPALDPQAGITGQLVYADPYGWQVLPSEVIYHSYLAGVKEPRFASQWNYIKGQGWNWDTELGGRAAIVRYGTPDSPRPQGWELDIEGAAFPRLNLEEQENLTSVDYRFGVPLTFGYGNYQMKFGYYHICSHLGDEYMLSNPSAQRINYVRNALGWGHSYYLLDALRIYGEVAWAFEYDGGAKPWEFQFGIEYSPMQPTGLRPVPFAAVNCDLRQELNFGGNIVFEAGWQWRSNLNHLFRVGVQYFNGKSDQYEFFNQFEEKIGVALWYDF
jgi:hypothetical protein